MKKLIFLFFVSMLSVLLPSCGKDGTACIHVKGRVTEWKNPSKGVPNARITIQQCTVTEDGNNSFCVAIDSTFTDDKGYYEYEKNLNDDASYWATAYAKDFVDRLGLQPINNNWSVNKLDFPMQAQGWVKYHVRNVFPFDDAIITLNPGLPFDHDYFYGKHVHTTVVGRTWGDRNYRISWEYTEKYANGGSSATTEMYFDSLFIKAHDTTFFEVKF